MRKKIFLTALLSLSLIGALNFQAYADDGLVDFDADGLEELFLVHTDPQEQKSCHPVVEVYAAGERALENGEPIQNFYGKFRDISMEATCTFGLVQQDGKIYLPTMSLESGITNLYGFTSAGSGTYDSIQEFSGNEFYNQKISGVYEEYFSIPYYVAARPEEGYEERKNDMEQTLTSAMSEILDTLGVEND